MHRFRLVVTALALTVILFSAFSAYGQTAKTGSDILLDTATAEPISEGEICPNYSPEFEPPTKENFLICSGSTIQDTIVATDVNDWQTLTISKISGPGTFTTTPSFSPAYGYYEYTPTEEGTFDVVYAVDDGESETVYLTKTYVIYFNNAPIITNGGVIEQVMVLGEIASYDVDASDAENDPYTFSLISGNGTIDSNTGLIQFTPFAYGVYEFEVEVADSCGSSTAIVTFDVVQGFTLECPSDAKEFICEPTTLCYPIGGIPSEADVTVEPPTAWYDSDIGAVCFYTNCSVIQKIKVVVSTQNLRCVNCPPLTKDSCTITVDVTYNSKPLVLIQEDTTLSLCNPEEICIPVGISDADDNIKTIDVTPSGFYNPISGQICVTPNETGDYKYFVQVIDECGAENTDSVVIHLQMNTPPVVVSAPDFEQIICEPTEICFFVEISDAEYNVESINVTEPGIYNPELNQVCFTATQGGTYSFDITVTDTCDAITVATTAVTVIEGDVAAIECPAEPIDIFLCEPSQVCYDLNVFPLDANVTVTGGEYIDGKICFFAENEGTHFVDVTAEADCGTDYCTLEFNVDFGEPALITCPTDPFEFNICGPTNLCIDLPVTPSEAVVISSIGEYANGQLCFLAEQPGTYDIDVTAESACGTDHCTIQVVVNQIEPAVIDCPTEPISKIICEPTMICYDLGITPLDAVVTTSIGEYTNGQLCFLAETPGTYNIDVTAETYCGTDNCTIQFIVEQPAVPFIDCPLEPLAFSICEPQTICFDLGITPVDANITLSYGEYIDGQICFLADPNADILSRRASSFNGDPDRTSGITAVGLDESGVASTASSGKATAVYYIDVTAETGCGVENCTVEVVVEQIERPVIVCPPDPIEFAICGPQTICYDLGITPIDAVVTTSMGEYINGQLCLDVSEPGTYNIDVTAETMCGIDNCTVTFVVDFVEPAVINCPVEPISFKLCEPQTVCFDLGITPGDASVTTSIGEYVNGQLCLFVDQPGSYNIDVTAETICGISNCTVTFDVEFIEPAVIDCPTEPVEFAICEPQTICYDLGITPANAVVTTSIGEYINGQLCLYVDQPGIYNVDVNAETMCGTSNCTVTFDVDFVEPATINCPAEPVAFKICEPQTICYDLDILPLDANVTTSIGTYSNGQLCLYVDQPGSYDIDVTAETLCGTANCTVTFAVDFVEPAVIDCPVEPVLFAICEPQTLCYDLAITPLDATVTTSIGEYVDGKLCLYVDESGIYNIDVSAETMCGTSNCTVTFDVEIVEPPVINCPQEPVAFEICEPQTLCFDLGITPSNATVSTSMGEYIDGRLCLYVDQSGTYNINVSAETLCGQTDCTVTFEVKIVEPPVIDCPIEPIAISICDPGQVCYDLNITPADAIVTTSIGQYINGQLCFDAETSDQYTVTVTAETLCGTASCDITFNVDIDPGFEITCPDDVTEFICEPTTLCYPLLGVPEGATVTVEPSSVEYNPETGEICFYTNCSVEKQVQITVTDECHTKTCGFNVSVTYNSDPLVILSPDTTLALCAAQEICIPVGITDIDNNISLIEVTPSGTYNPISGQICVNPEVTGDYKYYVRAIDECGAESIDSVNVSLEVNTAPVVTSADNFEKLICQPTEICFPVDISDTEGNIENISVSAPGVYDAELGQVCFTAETGGEYTFDITATDACGETATATTVVTVVEGAVATIECPMEPIDIFLCEPSQVCFDLPILPLDANITVTGAEYIDGQICFFADTEGLHTVEVNAEAPCGNAQCSMEFNVDFGEPAVINCPIEPFTFTICEPTNLCVDLGITPVDAIVTSSLGEFIDGQLCFTAEQPGTYVIDITATTACGADNCTIQVVVDQVSPAAIDCPTGPISKLICEPTMICYDLGISPAEAVVTTSLGEYSNGQLCFMADQPGTYDIDVTATTACGTDNCTIQFIVEQTPPAVIECPLDPFEFTICGPTELCLDLPITPAEAIVTSSFGEYRDGQLCFTAEEPGTYDIEVTAQTDCGTDNCVVQVIVDQVEPALISCPELPITKIICGPTMICYDLGITPLDAIVTTSMGEYSNGQLCFMTETAGTYNIDISAETYCGTDNCTIQFIVEQPEVPVIDCPVEPLAFSICEPQTICFDLGISPAEANITLSYGEYINGQICFFADPNNDILARRASAYDNSDGSKASPSLASLDANTLESTLGLTPTSRASAAYYIDVTAETECGTEYCTVEVIVDQVDRPVIDCPQGPIAFSICEPQTICFDLGITPVDAIITTSMGEYKDGQLCLSVDQPGTYNIDVSAETFCGMADCTVTFEVEFVEPAVINCPTEPVLFALCEPQTLCYDLGITPNDAVVTTSRGEYINGQLCLPVTESGTYNIDVTAETLCGTANCTVTFVVEFVEPPIINCPAEPVAFALCEPQTICFDLGITPLDATISTSMGEYINGQLCLFVDQSGSYNVDVTAETMCGTANCTVTFDVIFVEPAAIECPVEPLTYSICDPQTICMDLPITPQDAVVTTSIGEYVNGQLCLYVDQPGTYNVDVSAETLCGMNNCTVTIVVDFIEPATIDFPLDPVALSICEPQTICYDLEILPLDAVVTTSIGEYTNGQICFFAEASGTYNIDVTAETACGKASGIISFEVNLVEPATIDCPVEPVAFEICEPQTICYDLNVTPLDAIVTTSQGEYANGQICLFVEQSGVYSIDITAETICGSANCTVTFDVNIIEPAVINCPTEPVPISLCDPGQVCYDLGITPVDAMVTTSIGQYINGQLCFDAGTSGRYTVEITAETICGVSNCTIDFDVNIDSGFEIVCPENANEFICEPTTLCYPLQGVPANATVTVEPSSVIYNAQSGEICFYTNCSVERQIKITVEDGCHTRTCQFDVSVIYNSDPLVIVSPDTSLLVCQTDMACIPAGITDADDNIVDISVSPIGSYDPIRGGICFTPETSGEYELILQATDECGAIDADTVIVNVTINSAPTATCPGDMELFVCDLSEICVDGFICDDVDGNLISCEVAGGTRLDNSVCFTPVVGVNTVTLTATDECGETTVCESNITVKLNSAPTATCPGDMEMFVCDLSDICIDGFICDDIDNNIASCEVTGGTLDGNTVCFTPVEGDNVITLTTTDECGETATCQMNVDITLNTAPTTACPSDVDMFVCDLSDITISGFICDDIDGNLVSCVVDNGVLDGQDVTFTPIDGVNEITLTATDECGAAVSCKTTVTVTLNSAPTITAPDNQDIIVCDLSEICIEGFSCNDIDDNLASCDITGATLDGTTACFTPVLGENVISMTTTDECGETASKDIIFNVFLSQIPELTCPESHTVVLCEAGEVCTDVGVVPPDAVTTVSIDYGGQKFDGSYKDGQACFQADAEGDYIVTVDAVTPCGSTSCQFTITVDFNDAPTVDAGTDTEIFQCVFEEICLPISVEDINGNIASIVVSPDGYYDEATGEICFTPTGVGEYCLEVTVTDNCQLTASDIVCVNVTSGEAAVIDCPTEPVSVLLCEAGEVCIPLIVTPSTAQVTVSNGTFANNKLCFNASSPGTYVIDVNAEDACGSDFCRITVKVTFGEFAEITCPDLPVSATLCKPDIVNVTLPITPSTATVIVSPIGSYNFTTGQLSFFADTSGTYNLTVVAEAPCQTDQCDIQVNVAIEEKPILTCPGDIDTTVCIFETSEICFEVGLIGSASDITVSPQGSYNAGIVCIPINGAGIYPVEITASNYCGSSSCNLDITVNENMAPTLTVPDDIILSSCTSVLNEICIDGIFGSDPDGDEFTIQKISGPGTYVPANADSGAICFTPESNDITYNFEIELSDGCFTIVKSFNVTIYPSNVCETCIKATIETDTCYIVGSTVPVHIVLDTYEPIGGFDFLIYYDASVMAFLTIGQGDVISEWEYLTYSQESITCGGACPSGLIRIIGIADQTIPITHPPEEQLTPSGTVITLNMRLSHDQNIGGLFLPIGFYWFDCGDNTFSDPSGNLLYMDGIVYDPFDHVLWDEADDDLFPESNRINSIGAPDTCLIGDKVTPIRCVEFHNGGICVIHPDDIDDRGDLNLNGVAYEIADAVVYTNYFIYGFAAFLINVDGQTAASDINRDGIPLTVADLVYLIRILTGDAPASPKIAPPGASVGLATKLIDDNLSVEADISYPAGAGLFVFEYEGTPPQVPQIGEMASGMDMAYTITSNEVRILLYSFNRDVKMDIGEGEIINLNLNGDGSIHLAQAIFAGYYGEILKTEMTDALVPNNFILSQNYPNPFNPTTAIDLTLPIASDWEIEIFNAAGQVVRKFSDFSEPGTVTIVWDGTNFVGQGVASGIYFYRVKVADFIETRKMILLK